jgi:hypothetical protein
MIFWLMFFVQMIINLRCLHPLKSAFIFQAIFSIFKPKKPPILHDERRFFINFKPEYDL